MRSARTRTAAALAAAAVVVLASASAASAGDGDAHGGMWYYDVPDFDTIHQQTQGDGITIGVMDTTINPAAPDLVGANLTVHEPSYCATSADDRTPLPATGTTTDSVHATRMASIILGTGAGLNGQPGAKGIAPRAKVIAYAILAHSETAAGTPDQCRATTRPDGMATTDADVVDQAIADHVKILNMSWSGAVDSTLVDAVARAQHAGMILVAAASDQQSRAGGPNALGFPADLNGVVSVDGMSASGAVGPSNDWSDHLGVVAPGEDYNLLGDTPDHYALISGSSNATAFTSAALALVWSRYPQATANQILWDLVTNTNAQDHPLQHSDQSGYGVVNVRHMLEHDPTTYPDTNPLVSDDPSRQPSADAIAHPVGADGEPLDGAAASSTAAPAASAAAAPTGSAPATATGASHRSSGRALAIGGIVALALVAAAVASVVASRRRTGAAAPAPEPVPVSRSAGASHDD